MITNKKLFILFFLLPFTLSGQFFSNGYDEISEGELQIESTPLDTFANAIILMDYGSISLKKDYQYEFTHFKRIKILNQKGLDETEVSIPFYSYRGTESIFKIMGQTINVDEEGNIEKTPIEDADFYTVDLDEYWKEKKFTFPNAKVGSIIEYKFVKKSKRIATLQKWYFQSYLPIIRSEFRFYEHTKYDYEMIYSGDRLTQDYSGWNKKVVLENIAPIKEEPFCPLIEDYAENIQFQLLRVEDYTPTRTWNNFARDVLRQPEVTKMLRKKGGSKKKLKKVISKKEPKEIKLEKIFNYVQSQFKWDRTYGMYPDQSFKSLLRTKVGNGADINYSLVRFLMTAGFNARPCLVSTKSNGAPDDENVIFSQFNHAVAYVDLDGKDILLDATSEDLSYKYLPVNSLNELGLVLYPRYSKWVDVEVPTGSKSISSIHQKLEDDVWKYEINYKHYGYRAGSFNSSLKEYTTEQEFIEGEFQSFITGKDLELDSFKIISSKNNALPHEVICYYSSEVEFDGEDLLYVAPFDLEKHFSKNPFSNPSRDLPIDLLFPFKEKITFTMDIPEGYVLDEEISNANFAMPSKKCNYNYSFRKPSENQIEITTQMNIIQPFLSAREYTNLRELFIELMNYQEKSIVFKKDK